MKKIFCDRCKEEMDSFNKRELSYDQYKRTAFRKLYTCTINIEICSKCFAEFEKWLENKE